MAFTPCCSPPSALVSAVGVHSNAPYMQLWVVTSAHMLSPHWNLDSKGEDYTLFTLVFLGLEISTCGRKEGGKRGDR